jgi:Protein of unknown function (DUF1553)/Protein of unknown function (DUF1549)/Planctomycete cytochrome C
MHRTLALWLPVILGCLALASVPTTVPADEKPARDVGKLPPAATGGIDFQHDIQPILARSCVPCHSAAKQRGGLCLDDGVEALKGGNSGPSIKPGDVRQSRLLQLVAGLDSDLKMPPEGKPPLTVEEVGRLRAWIEQGAKWPKPSGPSAARGPRTSHWAFLPCRRPPVPKVGFAAWVRNEIDAFVLARLEAEGLRPSPEADRVTLMRRVSLDLLGLPPTPEEVDAFLADTSPDAYERLVERLLQSPHYGERWGRHWLDLARYADSDGFEKDTGRPWAWRFRDWVIAALNRDLPFDRFTIEQFAGDLLPGATPQQMIATGFHRNTLTNREGGVDREQFRVEAVVDRVNTTAKVWLGVTLGCAQCHDHKYDPFTQREYYQFFAFFNRDEEVDLPVPRPGEEAEYQRKKAEHDRKKAELQAAVEAYRKGELAANQKRWEDGLKLPELRQLPLEVSSGLLTEPAKRTDAQRRALSDYYSKIDKQLAALTKALTAHQKGAPALSLAQTLALGPVRPTHVLIRGDFLRPGVEVQPGTPAVLPPLRAEGTPTRLDLAKWLVDPANPLTPRVTVNWVWHHHFGRGLVATLEDFGTQGEKPSHPELLDRLADEFVRQRWSLKALHKLIVTSATYRQSSHARPELQRRDPLNVLLARQNRLRLEAEAVRDNALAASGLLVRTVGGPSVRPPQPPGISELTYAGSARWVESTGPDRYRRGMYTWFQRTSPYPMLMTFDAPDSNVCCVRRERSNTPLQALTTLNDTVFVECAQALGRRMANDMSGTPEERIRRAFCLCVAREPASDELAVLGRLHAQLLEGCKDRPPTMAYTALARTLLNLDEFLTRD